MEVSGQLHTPGALPPWRRVPGNRRLGGHQSRSGRGGEEKNSQPLQGLEDPIIQNENEKLVVKLEGKRLLGRPRPRWEDNIRMNRREMEWKCVDWMHFLKGRDHWRAVVNTVINLRVP
jgi:hypothetical protein